MIGGGTRVFIHGASSIGQQEMHRTALAFLAHDGSFVCRARGLRLGYGLMFTESRVLTAVLAELMERGIVALPLHDGLLCAQSRKEEAAEVMLRKAIDITGAAIPVEEKVR